MEQVFGKTLIFASTALGAVDSNVHGANAAHDAAYFLALKRHKEMFCG